MVRQELFAPASDTQRVEPLAMKDDLLNRQRDLLKILRSKNSYVLSVQPWSIIVKTEYPTQCINP